MTPELHHWNPQRQAMITHSSARFWLLLSALTTSSWAQTTAPSAFQRLDKNNDGQITRDEAPGPDGFAAADADKNGAVTPEEFRRYLANRSKSATPAPAAPTQPTPVRAAPNALFEIVDAPGFTDVKGEINGLALADLDHNGRLDIVRTQEAGLTVLINQGEFRFEPHPIQVSNPDGSPGRIGNKGEVPNFVDFNHDGHLDLFLTNNRADTGGRRHRLLPAQLLRRLGLGKVRPVLPQPERIPL